MISFFEKGKKITLEKAFKDLLDHKLLRGSSSISTKRILKDNDGRIYRVKLTIESIDYSLNKEEHKKAAAEREIELIKNEFTEV